MLIVFLIAFAMHSLGCVSLAASLLVEAPWYEVPVLHTTVYMVHLQQAAN